MNLSDEEIDALGREATAMQARGQYSEAVQRYRRILAARPMNRTAQENLALAHLGAGDYAKGFPAYEIRFTRQVGRVELPKLPFRRWMGEPLAGKSLMVWPEQGFGDQIMFARFAGLAAERGAHVIMVTPPPLVRLFQALPVEVAAIDPSTPVPRPDVWAMTGSLPGLLGVTQDAFPSAPYLPAREGGEGIGVVWRGNPNHPTNDDRSLPQELAEELLALPGARSLHPEDTGARDFQDTADIIAGLAHVVSVCTSAAHLAGAMGKPTSTLLMARNCDWRWMGGRSDTPWYPSMRLYRQPEPGDWRSVVDAVKAALGA